MSSQKSIRKTIQFSMLAVTALSIILVGTLWTATDYIKYSREAENLRDMQIMDRRDQIQKRVHDTIDYIDFMRSQAETRLKTIIKTRSYDAYDIVNHLYDTFKDTHSDDEIKDIIREALRPIRFNKGKGYYFATAKNGIEQLFADHPEYEGTNIIDIRDANGKYIIRDMIDIVNTIGEDFYAYVWTKPGEVGNNYEKISYVKEFKPFGWMIGTGIYVDDMKTEIQNEILTRIESIQYEDNGYIFVGRWDGVLLTRPSKGENMISVSDSNGVMVVNELIKLAKRNGGFISYVMPTIEIERPEPKISYAMGVSDWQWYVGSGFYLTDIEDEYNKSRETLINSLLINLAKNAGVMIGLLLLAYLVSQRTADNTKKSFAIFNDFFKHAASESVELDADELAYSEFQDLARSANRMFDQRRQAEFALRDSEGRYRQLFESSSDAIFILQGKHIFDCNPRAEVLFNGTKVELLGKTLMTFSPARQANGFDSLDAGDLRISSSIDGNSQFFEWQFQRADATLFDAEVNLNRIELYGQPYLLALVRDITERKLADTALLESEEKYRALTENSVDIIMRFDSEYRHLYVNKAVENLFQVSANEFIGKTHREMSYPEKMCQFWENQIEIVFETGQLHRVEFSVETQRSIVNFDWALFPEFGRDGKITSVMTSARDITEGKKLESQLLQSQKMETVGRLAGGIAHDFNNLLTVISGNAEMAAMSLPDTADELNEYIDEIKVTADRASKLTRQLLAFSRQQIVKPQIVNLSETLNNMHNMIDRLIADNIDLLTNSSENLWNINIDPGQVEQVITNLIVNACDAMADGGTLSISTGNLMMTEDTAHDYPDAEPGDYVLVDIRDTGVGMDKDTVEQIFEPFFTTKEMAKGTGLGLSICYGIISQNNGYISVVSEPGSGTLFSIILPRVYEESTESAENVSEVECLPGNETVLIAEDEPMVKKMISRILDVNGYTVIEAEDGEKALELVGIHNNKIDLLITDMIMPRMSGRELVEKVIAVVPRIKVLYISGYTENMFDNKVEIYSSINFLQKPFSNSSLLREVRNALDRE